MVMAAKLSILTRNSHKTAPSDRELFRLQFSLQAARPETFGYTLLYITLRKVGSASNEQDHNSFRRFPAGAANFSLHHRIQNGSGAHPASYPMGTRGSFPGGKAAGT
jgi:hypothetical protein